MDTKLTLLVDKSVVEKAKQYAREKNTSLSNLVENFLAKLTQAEQQEEDISPLVKSLSGVLKLEAEEDIKKEYADYLQQKYK